MSRRGSKPVLSLAAAGLATLSLGLSACGSDGSSDAAAPPATTAAPPATTAAPPATAAVIDVTADPSGSLAFTEVALTASPGPVTLNLTNDSPVPHNVAVKGGAVDTPPSATIQDGATADITVNLPAGTYTYYCAVPGHEAAGMKGTLTVE